jgi:hypothetical protein
MERLQPQCGADHCLGRERRKAVQCRCISGGLIGGNEAQPTKGMPQVTTQRHHHAVYSTPGDGEQQDADPSSGQW